MCLGGYARVVHFLVGRDAFDHLRSVQRKVALLVAPATPEAVYEVAKVLPESRPFGHRGTVGIAVHAVAGCRLRRRKELFEVGRRLAILQQCRVVQQYVVADLERRAVAFTSDLHVAVGRRELVIPVADDLVQRQHAVGCDRSVEIDLVEPHEIGPGTAAHLREDRLREGGKRQRDRLHLDRGLALVELVDPRLQPVAATGLAERYGREGDDLFRLGEGGRGDSGCDKGAEQQRESAQQGAELPIHGFLLTGFVGDRAGHAAPGSRFDVRNVS